MIGYFPQDLSWSAFFIGGIISAVLIGLIWILSNYLQKKLDANRLQTRIDLKEYVIIEAPNSLCPNCGKKVFLIQPKDIHTEGLSFYICSCNYLGIVGKDRVR